MDERYSPVEYLSARGDMFVGNAFLFTDDVVEVVDTIESDRSRTFKGATLWSLMILLLLLDDKGGFEGICGSWDDSGTTRVSEWWRFVAEGTEACDG